MPLRLLHYSDVETAYDTPERIGRLAGTLRRHRDASTAVVGTGDNTAPGVLALETDGRQALDFFDAVGPAVETFGNHDFDFALEDTRRLVAESPQPWVSANVYDDDSRFAGVDPAVTVERGGDTATLVGVTDPRSSVPDSLTVTDPVDAVREVAADCTADWLVVLAHVDDDVARALAHETPADVVLAGHVHDHTRERIGDALLVRTGSNGRYVWQVDLQQSPREIETVSHDVPDGPLDETVADALRERMADSGLTEPVAAAPDPVERDRTACLRGQCRIANFVTDAYRWYADADAAALDTRSVREGPPLSGDVTVAELISVIPFDAPLPVVELPGRRLRALVDEAVITEGVYYGLDAETADVWRAHFSGLTVTRDPAAGVTTVRCDGRPLDDDRTYRVAVASYLPDGDEFTTVSRADVTEERDDHRDALVEYARERGVQPTLDDRIRYVDENPSDPS